MGATYTRQSSYSDGDVIQANDTNNEFDQLLAAFASSSGHTHDGTTAEGGPITKLLGNSLTLGAGTADTDITVTFDGESNDGVLKWMEDEDHFKFEDDIVVDSTKKLYFFDEGDEYIHASANGQLDIVAGTEVQIAATTIDMNGNVDISGTLTIGGAGISEAELEILDGATVTTTEINILDGNTSIGTTAVSDGHGIVMNHGGTMAQTTVQTLAAYLDDEITAMPNLVTTAATTVGALNSGSITSGFGTIDTGSSTITTTGLITGGSLDIDDVVINGTTIGHTDDTDLITVASGLVTVAGEISVTTLDIGGTDVTSTATELNLLDGVSGLVQADFTKLAALDATAAELNLTDGNSSIGTTAVSDGHGILMNHGGTMAQTTVQTLAAYLDDEITAMPNLVTVSTLNSGAISSGFGAIDIGSSNLTATGTVSLGATSFNDNAITNVGDIALDSISADGTDINVAVSDNSATAFTIKQGSDAYIIVDTGNSSESVSIGTGISGTAITLGHATSEVTVGDNLTVTGNLTVSGTTTTVNSTTVNLNDHNIVLDSGNSTSAVINGAGITIEGGSGDDATFSYNTTGPQFELKLGSSFEDLQTAKLTASEIDLNGNLNTSGTSTLTGNVTLGGQLIMPDVTSAKILVADGTSFQEVAISGDVTIASNGAVTIASQAVENSMLADDAVGADELAANAVVNASVASGAAIAFSKMADLTNNRALVSDGSGDVSVSDVTSTEIGYLDGVTSAIQTQINTKATKGFATAMAIAL